MCSFGSCKHDICVLTFFKDLLCVIVFNDEMVICVTEIAYILFLKLCYLYVVTQTFSLDVSINNLDCISIHTGIKMK